LVIEVGVGQAVLVVLRVLIVLSLIQAVLARGLVKGCLFRVVLGEVFFVLRQGGVIVLDGRVVGALFGFPSL
jgi:hypothetical protein